MIYPLTEELPIIEKLLSLLRDEICNPNSCRDKILKMLHDSALGPRCGLFVQICNDVMALMGSSWSDDLVPIETTMCAKIQSQESRILHVIKWIDCYRNSSPDASLYPVLYNGALARLNIGGNIIAVTEVIRLHEGCILCYSGDGSYYMKYNVSHGFNDVEKVYKLNGHEVELLKSKELDIKELCKHLGCYVD
jgi:hypothetical protein